MLMDRGKRTARALRRRGLHLDGAQTLFVVASVCMALFSSVARASEACHIHPPGSEQTEPQDRKLPFYASLENCENFNKKLYGGRGRCHCFPEQFKERDGWRSWQKDFAAPDDEH